MKVNVTFTLDDKEDADIIRWLERQRRRGRSEAIRASIRAGWNVDQVRLERKVDEILRRLDNGVVIGQQGAGESTGERRAALDRLGL